MAERGSIRSYQDLLVWQRGIELAKQEIRMMLDSLRRKLSTRRSS